MTTISLRTPTTWSRNETTVRQTRQIARVGSDQRARVGLTDEEARTSTWRGVLIGGAVVAGLWLFIRELGSVR